MEELLAKPEVGGGVVLPYGDTVFQITAEVLEVDDSDATLRVKADGQELWVYQHEVIRVMSPSEFAVDNAVNVLTEDGE